MRTFNYSAIRDQKWDSEMLGLIAAIYKEAGKQELYLKQRPEELQKLVEIAKIQSTEASNAIEGIVTTSTRIRQLVEEKTTPKNRDEQEIAGYRDVLNVIHENFDAIPITRNYILQLHKILYGHMNNPVAGQTKAVQNYISATYPDGAFNGCRLYLSKPIVICIAGNIMFTAVIVYFQTTGLTILDNGCPLLQSDILRYSLNIVHLKPPEFKKCEKLRKFFNCHNYLKKVRS